MANQRWDLESDHIDFDKFQIDLKKFGEVKRFTCFFDNANFMMTKYSLADSSVHTVIENASGNTLQFSSLMCGYSGHGPSQTAKILRLLGLPGDEADTLSYNYKGLQITFPYKGNVDTDIWFESSPARATIHGIHLDCHTFTSILRRVVIFNEAESALRNVLSCFHVMKPYSIQYSLNQSSPLISRGEIFNSGLLPYVSADVEAHLQKIDLIVQGEEFEIYCGFSRSALVGTMNAIYFYLTGEPLFFEARTAHTVVLANEQIHKQNPIMPPSALPWGYFIGRGKV